MNINSRHLEEESLIILHNVCAKVRDELLLRYENSLTDTCDLAVDMTASLLEEKGFSGYVMDGVYRTKWGRMGHRWIEIEDLVIDPTRQQFGGKDMVFPKSSVKIYLGGRILAEFGNKVSDIIEPQYHP